MKYIAKITVILIASIALFIPVINAQTPLPSPPAVASPIPSAAADAGTSAGTNISPESSVAPAPKKQNVDNQSFSSYGPMLALFLPMMVETLGFITMVIVIVWLNVAAGERRGKRTHETIRLMIEKGQPVPPELFLDPKFARPRNDLRRGVAWIAAGTGIMGAFLASNNHFWSLGLIPLLMGIGYIVVWKIQGGEKKKVNPS